MIDILPSILSGAALLLAGAAFKFAYTMAQRITSVETKVALFWGLIEKNMSQLLHSPHRPSLDTLLDKNISGEGLTKQEAVQLVGLLQKLIDGRELTPNETSWATLLMAATVAKHKLTE